MKRRLSYKEVTTHNRKAVSMVKIKYPLSYYYLETEIRLSLAGGHFALEQNLKKYSKVSILKILLLKVWQKALILLKLPYYFVNKKTAYLNISRHLQPEKIIQGFQARRHRSFKPSTKIFKCLTQKNMYHWVQL